jgi:hypothetical protein
MAVLLVPRYCVPVTSVPNQLPMNDVVVVGRIDLDRQPRDPVDQESRIVTPDAWTPEQVVRQTAPVDLDRIDGVVPDEERVRARSRLRETRRRRRNP